MRLTKAGLLALAVLVASAVLGTGAFAHEPQHHVSMIPADDASRAAIPHHEAASPLSAVGAWSNAGMGADACPDGDHGRHHDRDHAGCCGTSVACSLHCGGAAGILSILPAPEPLTVDSPSPLEASFSIGLASAPGEPPPRFHF
jgi:hypothetical protein